MLGFALFPSGPVYAMAIVLPSPARVLHVNGVPDPVRSAVLPAGGRQREVIAPILPVVASEPPHVPPGPKPARLRFPAVTHFGFDLVDVNQRDISAIANALRGRGSLRGLQIDGYTDDLGAPSYNRRLSLRRACNVALDLRHLLSPRVVPMEIRAFGEASPVAPNLYPDGSDDPRGRALNRRVQIAILSPAPSTSLTCPAA
jgi:outer membrane protein OmpA-like peptidoglycan-associated protein